MDVLAAWVFCGKLCGPLVHLLVQVAGPSPLWLGGLRANQFSTVDLCGPRVSVAPGCAGQRVCWRQRSRVAPLWGEGLYGPLSHVAPFIAGQSLLKRCRMVRFLTKRAVWMLNAIACDPSRSLAFGVGRPLVPVAVLGAGRWLLWQKSLRTKEGLGAPTLRATLVFFTNLRGPLVRLAQVSVGHVTLWWESLRAFFPFGTAGCRLGYVLAWCSAGRSTLWRKVLRAVPGFCSAPVRAFVPFGGARCGPFRISSSILCGPSQAFAPHRAGQTSLWRCAVRASGLLSEALCGP